MRVTIFEEKLKSCLLWLACRHHISELLCIKHANEAVRGPSKGPDDWLFKQFKERFYFLDTSDRTMMEIGDVKKQT